MKYEPITAGNYYHIYNRGNNLENIFKELKNYPYFLNLLKKHVIDVADVLAYCLLRNHFHLIIHTKENFEDNIISRKFSNLFNAYSKAINKAYNRKGSLFQDRFSRKRIENEDYLKNLILYIHSNPVHHGFTEAFATYPHSSYKSILSTKKTLLDRDFVIDLFGNRTNFKFSHDSKIPELDKEITFEH